MHLSQRFRPAAKPRLLRPGAAPGSPRGRNAWRRRKKAPPAAEHSTVQQEESREPGRFRAPLRGSSEPEPLVAETPLHTERQTFLSSLIIFNSQPVATLSDDCYGFTHGAAGRIFEATWLAPSLSFEIKNRRPGLATWLPSNSMMTTRPYAFCPCTSLPR